MRITKDTPVITLHQPWCQWIALEWKTIETRLHSRFKNLKGKRIGIHVGKVYDKKAFEVAREYLTPEKIRLNHLLKGNGGYIICTAFVYDFKKCSEVDSEEAMVDCKNTKRYGLYLMNIEKNDNAEMKLYRGRQGIWYIN